MLCVRNLPSYARKAEAAALKRDGRANDCISLRKLEENFQKGPWVFELYQKNDNKI